MSARVNEFENVFIERKRKFRPKILTLKVADPLDGLGADSEPVYQRIDCIVFAEPALIIKAEKRNEPRSDVTLVKLEDPLNEEIWCTEDNFDTADCDSIENNGGKDSIIEELKKEDVATCDFKKCEKKTRKVRKEPCKKVCQTDENRFQCWDCDKSFPMQYLLLRHRTVHERTKQQCTVCFKMLSVRSSLALHMRSHSGEKPYTCLICGKSFTRRNGLNSHNKFVHAQKDTFDCAHCDSKFSRRIDLTYHMRDVHVGSRTLECELCGKCFSNAAALGAHRAKRHEVHQDGNAKIVPNNPKVRANTKSDDCNKSSSDSLQEIAKSNQPQQQPHDLSKTVHQTDDAMLKSPLIDANSAKLAKLVPQMPSPELCQQCGIVLPTRWYLIQHLRMHFPVTTNCKFRCQICEETLAGRQETIQHFDSWHSALNIASRSFSCQDCLKKFKRKDHLRRHLLTHTGEKPHQCHSCYKSFSRRSKLKEHLRKEHGECLSPTEDPNARPQNVVAYEMEQGLADGTKAVILNEGKVVGFKTVNPKRRVDQTGETENTNSKLRQRNLHPKAVKRKSKTRSKVLEKA